MLPRSVLLCCLLFFTHLVSATQFYLVRHAEKARSEGKDPELTVAGKQRAENLAATLATAQIKAIYSTDYQRTQMTAAPLAQHLGLPVISYDPADLPGLAEKLKKNQENALVVGHSNTTPNMVHLLSGQPTSSLDEVNYDNLYQINWTPEQANVTVLKWLPTEVLAKPEALTVRPQAFFEGSLTFEMSLKGEVVGQSVHQFNTKGAQYLLQEKTTVESFNIDADIMATVHSQDLVPLSMNMSGSMGAPVAIALTFHNQQIKGHSEIARETFKAQGRLDIDRTIDGPVYERTSLIMLAHLLDLKSGDSKWVQWYNGYDDDVRRILISHEGEATVTVPAGTFKTDKISFSGGAPSQLFYVDQNQPKVVKIEVVKSPWEYQLKYFD